MDADRVNVFHIAHGDAVVVVVAHDLVLDFFPPGDAAFNEHLMDTAAAQADRCDFAKLLLVVGKTAAAAAERVSRAHDDRVADCLCGCYAVFQFFRDCAAGHRLADAHHGFLKKLPVFRHADGIGACADHFHMVFFQKAGFLQLHGKVQGILPTEGRQDAVGVFLQNYLFDGFSGEWFNVNLVRNLPVRHNRGRVGVNQNDLDALFAQGAACLRAGIVELSRLTDDNRAGANDDDLFDFLALQIRFPPIRLIKRSNRKPVSSGPGDASGWNCTEKTLPFL